MWLKFSKMHGLGNDFMVVDMITQTGHFRTERVRELADRHFGIGFDQLLLVERPTRPDVDFRYRIFNADGSEVENCGNGARCFARFVYHKRLTGKRRIRVETANGLMTLILTDDDQVMVDMGSPILKPIDIPFVADQFAAQYPIDVDTVGQVQLGAVSMGNPHAVVRVDDCANAPVAEWGPLIEQHPRFPNRVNVGFLEVIDRRHGRLRVFERGSGETLACGTGACAAVVSGQLQGWFDPGVRITLPGGSLFIEWAGEGHSVMMTGPAETVFEGRINI